MEWKPLFREDGKEAEAGGDKDRRGADLHPEFSSPCQASSAIFKPSLPINPNPWLTDAGWEGRTRETIDTKK